MNFKFFRLVSLLFIFFATYVPDRALALDLIVEHNPSDSSHFSTIQSAIDYVTAQTNTTTSFKIVIEPSSDPYTGPITLISNVPIQGRETARTIITGGGVGTLFIGNNVTNVTIKNVTIINAATGIDINNSAVTITNNVFQSGTDNTALRIQNSPSITVINNTFYQNGTAINTNSDILITNNIFSNNGTAISSQIALTQTTYNAYYLNSTNGTVTLDVHSIPNASTSDTDPGFVNPGIRDFHLKAASSAHSYAGINAGNPNYPNSFDSTTFDMGVYGGTNSDIIPFQVQNVTASKSSADSVSVSWSSNESYLITRSTGTAGGYNVYYRLGESDSNTKLTLASSATSTIISGLTTTTAQPSAPVLNQPGFSNETLLVSWSAVDTATKYFVHYRDTDIVSSVTNTIEIRGTSVELGGLINGHHYEITVSAVAEPTYYFSVTAFDYTVDGASGVPGISHESDFSVERQVPIGDPSESPLSGPVIAFPEAIIPNPSLPDTGCFIATAAYGYYSAPQVQALRVFRDRYLLTNSIGKAFVAWYYRYGPIGAEVINAHSWLKPVVRIGLLPAVGIALFMTKAPFFR